MNRNKKIMFKLNHSKLVLGLSGLIVLLSSNLAFSYSATVKEDSTFQLEMKNGEKVSSCEISFIQYSKGNAEQDDNIDLVQLESGNILYGEDIKQTIFLSSKKQKDHSSILQRIKEKNAEIKKDSLIEKIVEGKGGCSGGG